MSNEMEFFSAGMECPDKCLKVILEELHRLRILYGKPEPWSEDSDALVELMEPWKGYSLSIGAGYYTVLREADNHLHLLTGEGKLLEELESLKNQNKERTS